MHDLAKLALHTACCSDTSYVDVRVVESTTERLAVRNGHVESIGSQTSLGFNVRVLIRGVWGFAASAHLDEAEVKRVVTQAISLARASALVPGDPVQLAPLPVQRGRYITPLVKDPFAIPLNEKVQLLLSADAAMRSVKGVTLSTAQMEYTREQKYFLSSEGSDIIQELYEVGAGISASAVDSMGQDMQTRSYPHASGIQGGAGGYELIEALHLVEHGARVGEEAVQLLAAPPCPVGIRTVILDGSQTALHVHESCGHAVELDRVLGMEAGLVGTSFLTLDALRSGYHYGSEQVSLTADATLPDTFGSFGWDDEGVPAQRTALVTQGILTGYLMSRETASVLGQTSNGCVRAQSWNHLPMIRMTTVNLEPGSWKLEQLLADTDDGLFLSTNKSWSIDDRRLHFQFGVELAYAIKGGKLGQMYKNATYAGVTPSFWRSCDAVCGKDEWSVWGVSTCGKGEPLQLIRTGHGAAPARFRQVQVGIGHRL